MTRANATCFPPLLPYTCCFRGNLCSSSSPCCSLSSLGTELHILAGNLCLIWQSVESHYNPVRRDATCKNVNINTEGPLTVANMFALNLAITSQSCDGVAPKHQPIT